jgi:hypothetical protein
MLKLTPGRSRTPKEKTVWNGEPPAPHIAVLSAKHRKSTRQFIISPRPLLQANVTLSTPYTVTYNNVFITKHHDVLSVQFGIHNKTTHKAKKWKTNNVSNQAIIPVRHPSDC